MSDTADMATEVVAEVAEEVAEQATNVAEISRGLSGHDLGLFFGGVVVGAGIGAGAAYFLLKQKFQAKYASLAAEEISYMREHYNSKLVALDNDGEKKQDLEDIVRERGYAQPEPSQPPMAVTPPAALVEDDDEEDEPVKLEAVPEPEPEVQNAFEKFGDDAKSDDEWDYHKERRRRSPNRPYVIHIDEREEMDTYDGVCWTYFEDDDVLVNEREEIVDAGDRERVIGEANLERFGHGSGDPDTVYIRNDTLTMVFEITRSPNSYAEELGFEPQPEIRHSDRRRQAFDDE